MRSFRGGYLRGTANVQCIAFTRLNRSGAHNHNFIVQCWRVGQDNRSIMVRQGNVRACVLCAHIHADYPLRAAGEVLCH